MANPKAWAPFYLVIYPVGSTAATTYLCMHLPVDNCPTHGPAVAAFAAATYPTVYGAGVIGHDHLMDFPGGSDFNIAWEPTFVLFTPQGAADGAINEHVLTDAQIQALVGVSAADCVGDLELWDRLVHPEDLEWVAAECERTNQTGEPFSGEYRMRTTDGQVRWVRDEAVLIRAGDGRPLFWRGS